MVKLFTSRLAYDGNDKINATVKSGEGLGGILAPTWSLVAGHKLFDAQQDQNQAEMERWGTNKFTERPTEPLNDAQYTERYLTLMRSRYAEDKQPFLDILNQPRATITCYCAAGEFCHRHIAVDVLEKIAERHNLPFERGGEIDPRTARRWVAPDDPDRRDFQFGVVPVFTAQGAPLLGYAAVGRLGSPKHIDYAIELAHFRSHDRADRYVDELTESLGQKDLPLSGIKTDLYDTERYLRLQARAGGLDGFAHLLTYARTKAWDDCEFTLTHSPEDMRFHPEAHEIRFGVLPIKALNGITSLSLAATPLLQQGDTHALLEIAHSANNGEERALQYLDSIEDMLEKGGFAVSGTSPKDVERTVSWLTEQARGNDLSEDWQPLTSQQAQDLDTGELSLTHTFREVRTLTASWVGRDWDM